MRYLIAILTFFGSLYFSFNRGIQLSTEEHLSLITANSIFAGFLFSGLSILVSIIDKPRIKRLNDQHYLDPYFSGVYIAIGAHLISIISSLIYFLGFTPQIISSISIAGLVLGSVFFSISVIRLIELTEKARFE